MEGKRGAWAAVAAYLFVLCLDGPALAWEYLRRNPLYVADWREHSQHAGIFEQWGLLWPESPSLDARLAKPVWRIDPEMVVHIAVDNLGRSNRADQFSLWKIPGRKSLLHDGRGLLLSSTAGPRVLRIAIAEGIAEGQPFVYVIRAGPGAAMRWRAVRDYEATLRNPGAIRPCTLTTPPGRVSVLHMRALQALDGRAAGASHRELAAVIFGPDTVARRWHADSELRAQVRHLLRRGKAFMQSEYRRLATQAAG